MNQRQRQIETLKRRLSPEQRAAHVGLFCDYANGLPIAWERVLDLVGAAPASKTPRVKALEVLGLTESATATEIKSTFRRLAREHHPDIAGPDGAERMRKIIEAYDYLENNK